MCNRTVSSIKQRRKHNFSIGYNMLQYGLIILPRMKSMQSKSESLTISKTKSQMKVAKTLSVESYLIAQVALLALLSPDSWLQYSP